MSWIVAGITAVSVGSSVYGNTQQNKAQKKQNEAIRTMSNAQAKLKSAYLEQSQDIKINDLLAMTQDIDNTVGLELTNLLYNAEQTKGEIKSSLAERNIYGNIASRINTVANIKQELTTDMIQGKLEQQYKAIATELDTAKLSYEREALDIQLGLSGALSQQNTNFKSTLDIVVGGVQAGISGASTGMGLKGSLDSGVKADVGSVNTKNLEAEAIESYNTDNNWWKGK